MNLLIRVYILVIGAVYWYGVFSGYYGSHGPYTNDNPNVYILPGVGFIFICVVIECVQKLKSKGLKTGEIAE